MNTAPKLAKVPLLPILNTVSDFCHAMRFTKSSGKFRINCSNLFFPITDLLAPVSKIAVLMLGLTPDVLSILTQTPSKSMFSDRSWSEHK